MGIFNRVEIGFVKGLAMILKVQIFFIIFYMIYINLYINILFHSIDIQKFIHNNLLQISIYNFSILYIQIQTLNITAFEVNLFRWEVYLGYTGFLKIQLEICIFRIISFFVEKNLGGYTTLLLGCNNSG